MAEAQMDRPAYELVRLIEEYLNDACQVRDTPERPNKVYEWAIREILEGFGGKPHPWSHPRCFDCNHSDGWHGEGWRCDLCTCMVTRSEVLAGKRDESLDDSIGAALHEDRISAGLADEEPTR